MGQYGYYVNDINATSLLFTALVSVCIHFVTFSLSHLSRRWRAPSRDDSSEPLETGDFSRVDIEIVIH